MISNTLFFSFLIVFNLSIFHLGVFIHVKTALAWTVGLTSSCNRAFEDFFAACFFLFFSISFSMYSNLRVFYPRQNCPGAWTAEVSTLCNRAFIESSRQSTTVPPTDNTQHRKGVSQYNMDQSDSLGDGH